MAVTHTDWRLGNQGHYIEIPKDATATIAIDLQAQLQTNEKLNDCTATVPSGIALTLAAVRFDPTGTSTLNHQQMLVVTPSALGTYAIKTISTTNQGRTIVKHFDIYTKE